jgi:hypothetical protein
MEKHDLHAYVKSNISQSNGIFHPSEPAKALLLRVTRWYIFKSKIPIWVNFGGP